jgi:hypothetical protein
MPAPTRTAISYLNTSSEALPKGPSRWIGGRIRRIGEDWLGFEVSVFRLMIWDLARLSASKVQPTALERALVKSPAQRTWTER